MNGDQPIIDIMAEDARAITSVTDFRFLHNKTILITGASGLVGGYLLMCLNELQSKFNTRIIAVIKSGLPEYIKPEQFKELTVFKGDITDIAFCSSLPFADFIIHAAGYGQPLKFMENPEITLKMNTLSTFLLFDKLNSGGHFVFISSSEVYSGLKGVFTEENIGTTNTTHPRSCYIEGKRGGEAICNAYRSKGIDASSVRLAHTYGPGTKRGDKRVMLAFIEKALQGEITMLDRGEAVRTYCYISDAVEIIWKILMSCKEPVYNLGGHSKTTIAALANDIGRLFKVPVSFPELSIGVAGAPDDAELDMSKVENEFFKKKYVSLEDGLNRTVSWYLSTQLN